MSKSDTEKNKDSAFAKALKMAESDNVSRVVYSQERKTALVFSKDMLVNQLRRDSPIIAKTFDELYEGDLFEISHVLSDAISLIYSAVHSSQDRTDTAYRASAELLSNATNSFSASFLILRSGYTLQPGILLRTVIESIGIAIHIRQEPKGLVKFQSGKLDSGYAVKMGTKVLPVLGRLYGYYSNNFSHVGDLHKSINSIAPFKEKTEAVSVNLDMFRLCVWLLYVTAELLFDDLIETNRYWKILEDGTGVTFDPDETERAWMAEFMSADILVD